MKKSKRKNIVKKRKYKSENESESESDSESESESESGSESGSESRSEYSESKDEYSESENSKNKGKRGGGKNTLNKEREITWILSRLQPNEQLDLSKTFEDQIDLINNTIILIVMGALDKETFPIINSVIYQILYNRHRHKREEFLIMQKSPEEIDSKKRRRHKNGCRYAKRLRRETVIDHLIEIKDKLLKKISKKDLELIKNNNRYHSPKVLETDSDDELTERKIVVKDLKWRSKTPMLFQPVMVGPEQILSVPMPFQHVMVDSEPMLVPVLFLLVLFGEAIPSLIDPNCDCMIGYRLFEWF
ncbi:12267_t:CDS:2 [Dentiscutata erythropus]|uniref:12267_t:CDS:1 n=1 Tax=Dentiscutata erythropus TaxID=1348616 RepID=A0A9N9A1C1_9GLOM|nr:12267_t:CDS:2 [Dentiscutata erythropus]